MSSKTQTVYQRVIEPVPNDAWALFQHPFDHHKVLRLDSYWGKFPTITVTVEPGNTLSEGDSE